MEYPKTLYFLVPQKQSIFSTNVNTFSTKKSLLFYIKDCELDIKDYNIVKYKVD